MALTTIKGFLVKNFFSKIAKFSLWLGALIEINVWYTGSI